VQSGLRRFLQDCEFRKAWGKLFLPFKGRAGVGMGMGMGMGAGQFCAAPYGAAELYSSFLIPYFFIFR